MTGGRDVQEAAETATGYGAHPPVARDRITGLDVTRGFAVMGILAMNIVAFAWPEPVYITPLAGGGHSTLDIVAWAFDFMVFDSKMRGLFSMMFGASTLLVIESAVAAGRSGAKIHYARMGTLALFGLAHFYFIWWGDILFLYACTGFILFFFRNRSTKVLARWGIGFLTISTALFSTGLIALRLMAGMPGKDGERYAKFIAQFAPDAKDSLKEIAIYQGNYAGIVHDRLIERATEPFFGALQYIPETLGLMLVGMALYKSGLFSGQWDLARLDKWRNRCFAIAIPANLALLIWQFASGLDTWVVLTSTLTWSVPFDLLMSIGYAATVMGLAQRFAGSPAVARVAATGRAAFSNYLGTSIIMSTIFYGYGLGLFAHVPRAGLYLFVVGAWMVMLLWSKPWLDRFSYGPMEWLWRTLARARLQPMRKAPSV